MEHAYKPTRRKIGKGVFEKEQSGLKLLKES